MEKDMHVKYKILSDKFTAFYRNMFLEWLMLFNVGQQKVMHIRLKMLQANYSINGNAHDVEHRNLKMTNSNYLGSRMSADVMYVHFPIFNRDRIRD
jgi:hypothetical protein